MTCPEPTEIVLELFCPIFSPPLLKLVVASMFKTSGQVKTCPGLLLNVIRIACIYIILQV